MSGQTAAPDPAEAADALASARDFYGGEQLRLPPLPRELAPRLAQFDEAEWGLLPPVPDNADEVAEEPDPEAGRHDLTDRGGFLLRATDPATSDDVAFGYVGHGVSSWWICYQLLRGPLALFIREGYGSPYSDPEPHRRTLNGAFRDAEAMIVLADMAANEGMLAAGQRLIVVLDDRGNSFWGLSDDPEHWQGSDDPFGSAEAFLRDGD